jgi:hypothetical protein
MKFSSNQISVNAFPSNRIIRRMGFSNDQEGIMRRYINEEGNWNEHLESTKNYIKHAIGIYKPITLAILGSGWLLDIPINFLAKSCEKLYLYDIRHPKPIVNRYRKYKNIEFVNMDITGGLIHYVFEKIKRKEFESIIPIPELGFEPIEKVDYTISVNLLNQLDILIVEYLRRFPQVKNDEILELRKKIQLAHLKSLQPEKSSLISDYEELLYDRTGSLVKSTPLIFHAFPEGKQLKEWIWKFDNNMTYYPNRITHFKVKAIQF